MILLTEEFVGHGSSVTCLALGQKSGQVMVTGGEDKRVNLWAIGKPNSIMSLSGHTTTIESVKFSQNEDLVCAGSVSGALKVWDLEAAKLLRTLTGHKSSVRCLDFHPYGDFVASGSLDNHIKLWDIRKKGCMYTYKGHSKDVHCLKFSPDGRWLASGGDEGSVKIWDLPAGKMLTEFKDHKGSVFDVCFHPNEFLLSSCAADGTVKFWDLETFQQVSTTVNDGGPIRKIMFHPDGGAIFSAARDVMKVYGWEPARLFDSQVMGWGKVNDIALSDTQLIGGTFSLTKVSVYVVDLQKVQPFGQPTAKQQQTPQQPPMYVRDSVARQSRRRNFVRGNCSTTHSQLESLESNRSEETETGTSDDAGDESSIAGDFKEVFKPRSELNRTPPPISPLATVPSMSTDLSAHRLSDPNICATLSYLSHPSPIIAGSRYLNGMRSVESLNGNFSSATNNLEMSRTLPATPIAAFQSKVMPSKKNTILPLPVMSNFQPTTTENIHIMQPVSTKTGKFRNFLAKVSTSFSPDNVQNLQNQKPNNLLQPRQTENNISVVRPVVNEAKSSSESVKLSNSSSMNGLHNNLRRKPLTSSTSTQHLPAHPEQLPHAHSLTSQPSMPRAAVIFPEQFNRSKSPDSPVELIPEARDCPAGLDIDEFLPKHLQANVKLGYHPQPEMSESEAIQAIVRGHKTLVTALSHRRKHLQIVLAMWSTKEPASALEQAINTEDQSVIVDIVNVITLKPAIWTLDMCQFLLPVTQELLQSKYESYMSAGCGALKVILKNFGTIIKTNITAPPGIGVDISREERYNKCMSCYNQLLSVRAFILKRQTLQGKLGRTFRELSILMQNLE